jgi:hypothetical protein
MLIRYRSSVSFASQWLQVPQDRWQQLTDGRMDAHVSQVRSVPDRTGWNHRMRCHSRRAFARADRRKALRQLIGIRTVANRRSGLTVHYYAACVISLPGLERACDKHKLQGGLGSDNGRCQRTASSRNHGANNVERQAINSRLCSLESTEWNSRTTESRCRPPTMHARESLLRSPQRGRRETVADISEGRSVVTRRNRP